MRLNIKQSIASSIFFVAFVTTPLLHSCKDDEAQKWVDLRYRVEQDAYTIDAKGTQTVTFQVKSTDPWEVFGENHYDWYTISPSTGDDPEKTYDVTITCKENTDLDDRTDIINIKSDYWTGKQFTLTQKGTAYLNVENVDMILQEGGEEEFDVLTNQKWTAEVTEGDIWLSIKSGNSGELDGKIVVEATPNAGEQRTGIVTIYDRHGEVAQTVECIQKGVVLNPEVPENGSWFAIYEQAQQLTIHVESNANWTISKEGNEADNAWFQFEETSFEGNGDIVINVDEHTGSTVRTGVIVLETEAAEGTTPVVKTVKFKQANPQIPEVHEVNAALGTSYGPGSLMPGRYNFYLGALGAEDLKLLFIWSGSDPYAELLYHVIGGKTQMSTTPWCSDVFNESSVNVNIDTNAEHVFSFEIQEKETETGTWIYTEWILDGKVLASAISDGLNEVNGTSDTWKVPFSQISAGGNFQISAGGSTVFKKWEYVAPLVWGD